MNLLCSKAARRAKILLHMLSICTKHAQSWTQLVTCSSTSYRSRYSHQIFLMRFLLHSRCSAHEICIIAFLVVFNICIKWILSELSFFSVYARHMQSATLIFKSFIDVSLCSVDATHMHRRDFDDQMWILLWSRLMLLTYASHRARSFFNSMSDLECARYMLILKFNLTSRIFFNLDSTFSISWSAVTCFKTSSNSWTFAYQSYIHTRDTIFNKKNELAILKKTNWKTNISFAVINVLQWVNFVKHCMSKLSWT